MLSNIIKHYFFSITLPFHVLFSQKELQEALEKAERRIKREKKQKEKLNQNK